MGALPDMLTFTPNGRFVLTANEGQPLGDYSFDPEGSVSIIDMTGGAASLTDADVTTADFRAFNNVTLDPSIRIFGPGATVAQDLEPEYLTVSHDSATAWVTLQENNALAVIDLKEGRVTSLVGLGFKDHNVAGFGLDGGRDDGAIRIQPWKVRGMYLPDGIASFRHQSETYLVTANEGDVREYPGINAAGTEVVEIEDIALDSTAFPAAVAATLKSRPNGIGRLKVIGVRRRHRRRWRLRRAVLVRRAFVLDLVVRRSPGVRQRRFPRADHRRRVPEQLQRQQHRNTRDDRSDDKGPEPEGVTVAKLFGRPYVFVMLERIGGIAVFEVTNPAAPLFVQDVNTRNFSAATNTAAAGDLGPEAARVVPAEVSPTGAPLLLVSNEVSGSLRVFTISAAH